MIQAQNVAKSRVRRITECPEAAGRENTARRLAQETDLTVDEARTILASTPMAYNPDDLNPATIYARLDEQALAAGRARAGANLLGGRRG